ncbi:uncharacterized protein [Primulina eburnea]|uniref:uncharacterized protein n=1 Tax=Primulina eburnea TaxID=1245227 RepID=UPI003C6BDCA3
MFDGLLKSKFFSRCKSDIKQTKTRIELIKKKRNAMEKYLRNDIADLLKNGLDTNAYGRAEGLLNELNRSSCFEFVDQCCVTIANNLGTVDKQRECPQECREAVASLMFAAARLAELPELRQLRTLFSERYTNSLDFYVDKQFMEKLKSSHPSKEMKLQLLHDIATESGVEWSSKALENKLYHETAGKKDIADAFRDKLYVPFDRMEGSVLKNESRNRSDYVRWNPRKCTGPERKDGLPGYEQKCRSEDVSIKDIQVDAIKRNEMYNYNQPESRVQNQKEHDEKPLKYGSIPPPYIKADVKKTTSEEKAEPKETDDQEYPTVKPKPAPKSVRRRPLKPPPAQVHSESDETPKETNKEQAAAQGQRVLKFLDEGDNNERDEEEKMMDKLLLHYSRKKTPRGTVKSGSSIKMPQDHDPGHSPKATKHAPNRVSSLPSEATTPTSETHKQHARAFSLQPEMFNGNGHVHPKLPDYDEFVARLAALRRS